jgi:hypothetical protein
MTNIKGLDAGLKASSTRTARRNDFFNGLYNRAVNQQLDRANPLRRQGREPELQARRRARERNRVIGLLLIALFILALAFVRFGKHVPWGAR